MNFTRKKLFIGLSGFIVSAILFAIFASLSPTGNITELPLSGVFFRILSLLFLPTAISFIFYIFSNKKGFFIILSLFLTIVIIMILVEFTSNSNPSIALSLITLVGIALIVIPSYTTYKSIKISLNGSQLQNDKINAMIYDDGEFKKSIGYIQNSIIVSTQGTGSLFQVIKTNKSFIFHHIGNSLSGIDKSKIIKNFSNIDINKDNKKDYILTQENIDKISAVLKDNNQIINYGNITISLKNGKNKRYVLINSIGENDLTNFFDNNITIINKTHDIQNIEYSSNHKKILNKLNKFFCIYSTISSVIFGLYFILYANKIANVIFTTLCIIICLIPFVSYIKYPKYITLKESNFYNPGIQNGKLNISQNTLIFPLLFALIALIISPVMYMYYDAIKLIIYSAILFVVFIATMLIFTKEYKKEKSTLFVIIMIGLILCPTIIHTVDTSYDYSTPQQIACEIIETTTWTNNNDEITYYLIVNYQNKNIKTEVSQKTYEKYNAGDNITVIKKQGLFGIEKLIFYE